MYRHIHYESVLFKAVPHKRAAGNIKGVNHVAMVLIFGSFCFLYGHFVLIIVTINID